MSSARRLKRSLVAAALAAVCPALFAGTGAAAAPAAAPALAVTGAHPAVTAGTWGNAEEVPGLQALNHGFATVDQMSCPSAGNCSAGGIYSDANGVLQFYVVDETNGVWGTAIPLPGVTMHNANALAGVDGLSCASAGNCSAAFNFAPTDINLKQHEWLATETNGVWGNAIPVPGLRRLETGNQVAISGLSCKAPGDCSAGGVYVASLENFQPFVLSEINGTWHTVMKVPGFAALGPQGGEITVLTCDAPGSCSAGGDYQKGNRLSLFTVTEQAGTWQQAVPLPGINTLNKGTFTDFTRMSCPAAGSCSAGGHYTPVKGGNDRAFVVTESGGRWGAAQAVQGIQLGVSGESDVSGLACTSPGNCLAAGSYEPVIGQLGHAYVAFEKNGVWSSATTIPGLEALNTGPRLHVNAVSCGAPGDCSVVGNYTDHRNNDQAYVASEVNGRWVTVEKVPGTAALNTGGFAATSAVSCDAAGNCGAGGDYTVGSHVGPEEAFVVNQS